MARPPESFRQFVKAHREQPVLSVYVSGGLADLAAAHSWTVPLRHALRRARAAAQGAPPPGVPGATAEAFEAGVRAVLAALPDDHAIHAMGGWCALVAPSENGATARFTAALPAAVPTQVHWQAGAVVLPYLAAASEGPVLVLQLERDAARLARVDGDTVTELARDAVDVALGAAAHMGNAPRQGFHTGTRGEALTDLAQRRLLDARQQLLTDMLARAVAALEPEGVLLFGGAEEVGRHARALLPDGVAERAAWSAGLRAPLPDAALGRAIRPAVAALRDGLRQRWLDVLREGAHPNGHGATGVGPVRQALARGAVERLLLSTGVVRRDPGGTEAMARDATLQGAAVSVVDHGAGERLDRIAGGAAALLRFPIPALAAAAVSPAAPLSLPLAGEPA